MALRTMHGSQRLRRYWPTDAAARRKLAKTDFQFALAVEDLLARDADTIPTDVYGVAGGAAIILEADKIPPTQWDTLDPDDDWDEWEEDEDPDDVDFDEADDWN